MQKKRLYRIWINMKSRCRYENGLSAKYYYDKNILVCDKWFNSYINFKKWALNNGYKDNLTIERLDNNDGYNPNNCIWIERKYQNRNKDCVKLSYRKAEIIRNMHNNVKIKKTLLAKIFGVSLSTIYYVLNNKIYYFK